MAAKNNYLPFYIGGAGIALLAAYKFGLIGDIRKGTDQNADININKNKLSDPSGIRYKNIASNLYREFDKIGITSGAAIISELQGLNTEELKAVAKAFGTRCSSVSSLGFTVCIGEKKNLFQWIESDLSSNSINKLKSIFSPTNLW